VSEQRIWIRGGRILDPAAERDEPGDVLIEGGVIVAVGAKLDASDAEVIDAKGAWIAPGFVDLHTHLREPGQEYKEDIASGGRSAVAGGFAAVATFFEGSSLDQCQAPARARLPNSRERQRSDFEGFVGSALVPEMLRQQHPRVRQTGVGFERFAQMTLGRLGASLRAQLPLGRAQQPGCSIRIVLGEVGPAFEGQDAVVGPLQVEQGDPRRVEESLP